MAEPTPKPRLPRQVRCPHCGKEAPYQGNPWRPFCSERCRTADLGAWASGDYAIPAQDDGPSGEDEG
jgi:hypothetical protein